MDRAWQMARHYRWSQMARRGIKVLRRCWPGQQSIGSSAGSAVAGAREDLSALRELSAVIVGDRRRLPSERRSDLAAGSIDLLNVRLELGNPLDWTFRNHNRPSHLWRFQLHYHEFLLPLAERSNRAATAAIWRTVDDWIENHAPERSSPADDAWHPYCISRRIPVWIWLFAMLEPPPNPPLIVRSLQRQIDYLVEHIEVDPGGNHLLENIAAIALAAAFLDGAASRAWLATAERRLRYELPRQILEHGEHFELAPMYHCQVLGNLLIIARALKGIAPEAAEFCRSHARRMIEFISAILHPDGEIPLFGDSGFGECPSIGLLRELAVLADLPWSDAGAQSQASGPYWVQRSGAGVWILDGGQVGASDLPAHAHCDLLGHEASIGDRRWFVDSGNFDYEAGSMRRYCRSAVAHNVVTVDDFETCDVWSKFRMGLRGRVTHRESGEHIGAHWFLGRHDAYRRRRVRWLDRLLVVWGDGWLCSDFAHAAQRPKLTGYLHLAPDLSSVRTGARQFELSDGIERRRLSFFGVDEVDLGQGWYSPEFGRRQRNTCLIYRQQEGAVTPLGWLLESTDATSMVEVEAQRLFWRRGPATFEWSFE
jgi:uncharacterized heparinase superfamily protein